MTDNRAEQQARAQLDSIKEMIAALHIADGTEDDDELQEADDAATNAEQAADKAEEAADEADEERGDDVAGRRIAADNARTHANRLRKIADEIEANRPDADDARETIQEDPLSVEIRTGWYTPGTEDPEPEEFCILLCTGGPAVRIIGELDRYKQPTDAEIQYQDWGTGWTTLRTTDDAGTMFTDEDDAAILEYCQQFYFGE